MLWPRNSQRLVVGSMLKPVGRPEKGSGDEWHDDISSCHLPICRGKALPRCDNCRSGESCGGRMDGP